MTLLLSRYIARRFAGMLAMILAALFLVVLIADYVEVLRRFSDEAGFTALAGLKLVAMRVPLILDTALPFAFLFSALLSLLTLSRRSELVVARAGGVSVWGFLSGPFAIALVVGILAITIFNPVAVALKGRAESLEAELSGRASASDEGTWFRQDGSSGPSILHAGTVSAGGRALHGVTAYVFDAGGAFREKVMASRADFSGDRWRFTDAKIVSASDAPRQVPRYELPTDLTAEALAQSIAEPDAASLWSLPGLVETAYRTGLAADRFRVALHELLSRPLFLLAMVLIAANVTLRPIRSGGAWRLMLTGVTAGFLLYVFTEIVSDLGANGIINPVLAAWLPPIAALTFGATALLHQEDG